MPEVGGDACIFIDPENVEEISAVRASSPVRFVDDRPRARGPGGCTFVMSSTSTITAAQAVPESWWHLATVLR